MRKLFLIALLSTAAAPAVAAPAPREPALPPEVADGRMVDQIGTMVGAVTRALLDLPVGELEAAVENRPVTRADRSRTLGSVTGTDERELAAGIEQGKGAIRAGGEAMARAVPVIREAIDKAAAQIDRVTANVPQPGYPRR